MAFDDLYARVLAPNGLTGCIIVGHQQAGIPFAFTAAGMPLQQFHWFMLSILITQFTQEDLAKMIDHYERSMQESPSAIREMVTKH